MKKKTVIFLSVAISILILGAIAHKYRIYGPMVDKVRDTISSFKENTSHNNNTSVANGTIDYDVVGSVIDSYKGVATYSNGKEYTKNYGKSYSKDGYYYGYKWQCVEHVKRFYYEAKNHKMPDGYGNAKDFFDEAVPQGQLNKKRGLVQYRNGGNEAPKADDLIVFNDTKYGHVAIVSEVGEDYVEIIQQNVYEKPRVRYQLVCKEGKYYIEGRKPAGWLREK